jgi:hypothetical protein
VKGDMPESLTLLLLGLRHRIPHIDVRRALGGRARIVLTNASDRREVINERHRGLIAAGPYGPEQ